jgi:uncharacterized protein (TIGR00266 family)
MRCKPSYTVAYCELSRGERLRVERDAMVCMSSGIKVVTGVGPGGITKAIKRRAFGGESFFMGTYEAERDDVFVAVAPPYPGDLTLLDLDGSQGWMVEQGAFVASNDDIDVDVKYAGLRNVVIREGITMLHIAGRGQAVIGSYGGLNTFDIPAGGEMIVDSGHLVAYTDNMSVEVGLLGGAVASATTGEGVVAKLRGPGSIWLQTRSERGLSSWLFPNRQQNNA